MIKQFSDYAQTKAYADFERLPRGGYVLVIKGAELHENTNGQYVKIMCDVAEGDYKDFYLSEYTGQPKESRKWHCNYLLNIPNDDGSERDSWTKRKFKTVTEALEESNEGYHFDWDERKFKGKLIGGIFNEREYKSSNGDVRRATNLAKLCTVDKIRSGNYRIPEDKLLGLDNAPKQAPDPAKAAQASASNNFMYIPDGEIDDLPFN